MEGSNFTAFEALLDRTRGIFVGMNEYGRTEPVCYDSETESWVVTGYAEGLFVLRRDDIFSAGPPTDETAASLVEDSSPTLLDEIFHEVIFLDGEAHRRVRAVLDPPLAAVVKAMRPAIERLVCELLAAGDTGGELDVEDSFAVPLTVRALAQMFGIPADAAQVPRLREWSDALVDLTTGVFSSQAMERVEAMHAAFAALLEAKRAAGDDDLAGAYAADERLSEAECVIAAMVVFAAGNATTTTLLTNAMPELLGNASSAKLAARIAQEEPAALGALVHELLRLITPTQYLVRYARRAVTIGSVHIQACERVVAHLARMNRDPAVFADPDRFDPQRVNAHRHVAFGAGTHRCPGASFALLEAAIAFKTLLTRRDLRLCSAVVPAVYRNDNQRRCSDVRVAWSAPEPSHY